MVVGFKSELNRRRLVVGAIRSSEEQKIEILIDKYEENFDTWRYLADKTFAVGRSINQSEREC